MTIGDNTPGHVTYLHFIEKNTNFDDLGKIKKIDSIYIFWTVLCTSVWPRGFQNKFIVASKGGDVQCYPFMRKGSTFQC